MREIELTIESEVAFGGALFDDETPVAEFVASQPDISRAYASAAIQVVFGVFCAYLMFPLARWALSAWADTLTFGVGEVNDLAQPISVLVIIAAFVIVLLSAVGAVQTILRAHALKNETRFVLTDERLLGIGSTEPKGLILVGLDRLESVVAYEGIVVFRGVGGTVFKFEKVEFASDVPAAFSAATRIRTPSSTPTQAARGLGEQRKGESDGRKWKGRSSEDDA